MRLRNYILEGHLQEAAFLLRSTGLLVKEVASRANYNHTSSFSRAFKRRFLVAPEDYRRTCSQWNALPVIYQAQPEELQRAS